MTRAALIAGAALAGCTELEGPEYRGELLAAVRGVATLAPGVSGDSFRASLAWLEDDRRVTYSLEGVALPGAYPAVFPAGFQLELYAWPPASARRELPERGRYGLAYLTASSEFDDLPDPARGFGDHAVVYAERAHPDGPLAAFAGAPVRAGLSLWRLVPVQPEPGCAPAPCATMRLAPADELALVRLVIEPPMIAARPVLALP